MFQSLLGFLMRCDRVVIGMVERVTAVSIPAGFSDALRLGSDRTDRTAGNCFNPCWVF